MAGIGVHKAYWVTAAALSCFSLVFPAWGSPPSAKSGSGAAQSHPGHLDLRAPTARELGEFHAATDRFSWGASRAAEGRDGNLSGFGLSTLGAPAAAPRTMSAPEAFVRRFHREGLPVARLWEGRSALVSLGLNAKGKPGLWLVQKTR
jgi:hypothetical protein